PRLTAQAQRVTSTTSERRLDLARRVDCTTSPPAVANRPPAESPPILAGGSYPKNPYNAERVFRFWRSPVPLSATSRPPRTGPRATRLREAPAPSASTTTDTAPPRR